MLPIDVYNNGATAIFGIYFKEALPSPLMYTAMAILRVSVYMVKKLCVRCRCMDQW